MHVANIELCRTLHELSGWEPLRGAAYSRMTGSIKYEVSRYGKAYIPAYDLGYLLRKLPPKKWNEKEKQWDGLSLNVWQYREAITYTAEYWTVYYRPALQETCKTPEDAAAKLCIELFKQGILTKEAL